MHICCQYLFHCLYTLCDLSVVQRSLKSRPVRSRHKNDLYSGSKQEKNMETYSRSIRIGNYALKTSLIASTNPPESLPASTMTEVKYCQPHLYRRYALHINTCKRGLGLQKYVEKIYTFVLTFFTCEFCL